jgi:hypothetical protein
MITATPIITCLDGTFEELCIVLKRNENSLFAPNLFDATWFASLFLVIAISLALQSDIFPSEICTTISTILLLSNS